tara:strand:- start:304 stop:498 length:195 start_codon:yes stop_codon:yes gene_type:complete
VFWAVLICNYTPKRKNFGDVPGWVKRQEQAAEAEKRASDALIVEESRKNVLLNTLKLIKFAEKN